MDNALSHRLPLLLHWVVEEYEAALAWGAAQSATEKCARTSRAAMEGCTQRSRAGKESTVSGTRWRLPRSMQATTTSAASCTGRRILASEPASQGQARSAQARDGRTHRLYCQQIDSS